MQDLASSDPELFDQYASVIASMPPARALHLATQCGNSMPLLAQVLNPQQKVVVHHHHVVIEEETPLLSTEQEIN